MPGAAPWRRPAGARGSGHRPAVHPGAARAPRLGGDRHPWPPPPRRP